LKIVIFERNKNARS